MSVHNDYDRSASVTEAVEVRPLRPAAFSYSLHVALDGFLDEQVFRRCVGLLPERHPGLQRILRAGVPQCPADGARVPSLPLTLVDMRGMPMDKREEELRLCLEKAALGTRFAEDEVPMSATLYRVRKWRHSLSLVLHPSIADADLMRALLDDLTALYAALVEGDQLPDPPSAVLQERSPVVPRRRSQLPGAALEQDLQTDDRALCSALHTHEVSIDTVRRLQHLAQHMGLPRERLMFAAFAGVVSRYVGETRFCLARLGAADGQAYLRPWSEVATVEIDLDGRPSFREWSNALHVDLVTGQALVASDELQGVGFAWAERPKSRRLVELEMRVQAHRYLPLPLFVTATVEGESLILELAYDSRRYEGHTMQRLGRHLETLLHGAVTFPDQPVHQLPMLTREERTLLRDWQRGVGKTTSEPLLVHEIVQEAARHMPDHPALADGPVHLTYGQLDRKANQLAGYLRAQGLRCSDPVALMMQPCADMVVAALGVLKAGGVLLPLAPSGGAHRTAQLLGRAGVRFVFGRSLPPAVLNAAGIRALDVCRMSEAVAALASTPPEVQILPEDPALLRFPVMGTRILSEHASLMALIQRQSTVTGVGGGEHIVYMTLLESDTWVADLFAVWKNGGTALLAGMQDARETRLRALEGAALFQ